jgi:hypothetical protein
MKLRTWPGSADRTMLEATSLSRRMGSILGFPW